LLNFRPLPDRQEKGHLGGNVPGKIRGRGTTSENPVHQAADPAFGLKVPGELFCFLLLHPEVDLESLGAFAVGGRLKPDVAKIGRRQAGPGLNLEDPNFDLLPHELLGRRVVTFGRIGVVSSPVRPSHSPRQKGGKHH